MCEPRDVYKKQRWRLPSQGCGSVGDEGVQTEMLSFPSSAQRQREGSCRKHMTYIPPPFFFFPDRDRLQQWGLPRSRTYREVCRVWRERVWGGGGVGVRETEIGTLPTWNRQTWKGGRRQKENGESFDGNPLRLSLPPLSNAYVKHIYNSVPFTSKRFAICIYIVSREKHAWCVLEGKSESKLSFFGEYSDPSPLGSGMHLSEPQTSDDIFIIRGRTHYSKKK